MTVKIGWCEWCQHHVEELCSGGLDDGPKCDDCMCGADMQLNWLADPGNAGCKRMHQNNAASACDIKYL